MNALELLPHLVTLVAAFVGAWFAFLLQDRAKARQTIRDQVAAINRAQFALMRQFNTMKNIQAQVVEPVRQHPAKHVAMRAVLTVHDDVPQPDLDALSFLLETDDRELLLELMIENQRFKTAVQAINDRSRLHLDVVRCLRHQVLLPRDRHGHDGGRRPARVSERQHVA